MAVRMSGAAFAMMLVVDASMATIAKACMLKVVG